MQLSMAWLSVLWLFFLVGSPWTIEHDLVNLELSMFSGVLVSQNWVLRIRERKYKAIEK